MKLIHASARIEAYTPDLEELIEAAGRTCWKSEDKIETGTAAPFIERLKNLKHESVLEHGAITVRFIIDRGVSHELVRHRLASFSQESTRYCNYSKGKHGHEILVIDPRLAFPEMEDPLPGETWSRFQVWQAAMAAAEQSYFTLLAKGAAPQEARAVLPNSLKTEVVMTTNPREWRHVFKLRCNTAAHPQIREVMLPLRATFATAWPALFNDLLEVDNDR